jgi:valyl-tRNA synthetase
VEKVDENYMHKVAINYRGGGLIEPQIKLQWWIDVDKKIADRDNKSLKDLMKNAVKSGKTKINPARFEKIYYHWIDNLRDWCISRQIIYGHQIPVWYKGKEIHVDVSPPKDEGWEQDPDTLDTWFSSGLWTFSTLGWPQQTQDLKNYHPTSVMMPGYEILFFWVARMILMSGFLLEEIPFHQVYLHGIVRDKQGRKFSKSLNNGIDPLEIMEKYGTDALRLALIFGAAPGNDVIFDEQKVKGMKHFANKLWNISRFVLSVIPASEPESSEWILKQVQDDKLTPADKDILAKLQATVKASTEHLENFRLHEAAQSIYHFVWHEFADIYIEASKQQLADDKLQASTYNLLTYNLLTILKLLHPFMPFITEHLWQLLKEQGLVTTDLLMVEKWPQ